MAEMIVLKTQIRDLKVNYRPLKQRKDFALTKSWMHKLVGKTNTEII